MTLHTGCELYMRDGDSCLKKKSNLVSFSYICHLFYDFFPPKLGQILTTEKVEQTSDQIFYQHFRIISEIQEFTISCKCNVKEIFKIKIV